MSKEKLQEIIIESFLNDKIPIEKFISLSEKVENITKEKAIKVLSEVKKVNSCVESCIKKFTPFIEKAKISKDKKLVEKLKSDCHKCSSKCK